MLGSHWILGQFPSCFSQRRNKRIIHNNKSFGRKESLGSLNEYLPSLPLNSHFCCSSKEFPFFSLCLYSYWESLQFVLVLKSAEKKWALFATRKQLLVLGLWLPEWILDIKALQPLSLCCCTHSSAHPPPKPAHCFLDEKDPSNSWNKKYFVRSGCCQRQPEAFVGEMSCWSQGLYFKSMQIREQIWLTCWRTTWEYFLLSLRGQTRVCILIFLNLLFCW